MEISLVQQKASSILWIGCVRATYTRLCSVPLHDSAWAWWLSAQAPSGALWEDQRKYVFIWVQVSEEHGEPIVCSASCNVSWLLSTVWAEHKYSQVITRLQVPTWDQKSPAIRQRMDWSITPCLDDKQKPWSDGLSSISGFIVICGVKQELRPTDMGAFYHHGEIKG